MQAQDNKGGVLLPFWLLWLGSVPPCHTFGELAPLAPPAPPPVFSVYFTSCNVLNISLYSHVLFISLPVTAGCIHM